MGLWSSSFKLPDEEIHMISEDTGFTESQIKRLWGRFQNLDKGGKGHLTRQDFLAIPELENNPLGERIVQAFFQDSQDMREFLMHNSDMPHDAYGEDIVYFYDFVRVFAHFKPVKRNPEKNLMNSREDKLRFAFNMYDMDNDGVISKDELLAFLTLMVGENVSQEELDPIVERMVVEADLDGDDLISFDEFCKVLHRIDVEKKMSIRFLS